jgi:hypothetical protein
MVVVRLSTSWGDCDSHCCDEPRNGTKQQISILHDKMPYRAWDGARLGAREKPDIDLVCNIHGKSHTLWGILSLS